MVTVKEFISKITQTDIYKYLTEDKGSNISIEYKLACRICPVSVQSMINWLCID